MTRQWRIAWLLFFATLLNYLDRQILSLVSPVLRVQFGMSATQYSHLLSSFLVGYTAMQILAGWVVDRIGIRWGLTLAMLWWSTAGVLSAFADGPKQLAVCLFLLGIGEAANWPTAVKAVQEWFPPDKRAVATGLFNAGSSAGAILAPAIVETITLAFSWRAAFALCGSLGMLWILPWRITCKGAAPAPEICETAASRHESPWRDPRIAGVLLARFFADSIWYFYIFWLPDYLFKVQSFSLRQIGGIAWIPFVAAAAGNFCGGAISGALVRRGWKPARSRIAAMAGSAAVMFLGAFVKGMRSPTEAVGLICVVVFSYSSWAANVLTLPGDLFPSELVATVTGAAGTLAGLGGVLSTLVVGRVVDRYSYGPVFWGVALLPIAALLGSLLTLKGARSSLTVHHGVIAE